MGEEEWVSVLNLATKWEYLHIRDLAVAHLSEIKVDAVKRIVLAKTYSVDDWLLLGYMELAKRVSPIDMDEASRIGLESTLRLYQAREEVAKMRHEKASYNYARYGEAEVKDYEVRSIIQRFSGSELEEVHERSLKYNVPAPTKAE